MSRIARRFAQLKAEDRAAFIPFVMAGDPDGDATQRVLEGLPGAGADLIELGVCFTDPMADGPAIQAAGLRARAAGQTLARTLDLVRRFRSADDATPIILMGYCNPFFAYGIDRFADDAADAGVDGLIIVDLPPEEDGEWSARARNAGIDVIRLATPTTDDARLPAVVGGASGFVYYVSVAGVTGQKTGEDAAVGSAVQRIKAASGLPVAVGFGIKTPASAAMVARAADAVVVGSALVDEIAKALEDANANADIMQAHDRAVNNVLRLARDIGDAVKTARTNPSFQSPE